MPNNKSKSTYKGFFPDHRKTPEAVAAALQRRANGELPKEPWEASMIGYTGYQNIAPSPPPKPGVATRSV